MAYMNQKAVNLYILLRVKLLCYLMRRSGLTGSRYKGVLDKGFSSCAVPAFCHGPGILSCMQVYVLPMNCREVTESKGTMEILIASRLM